MEHMETSTSSVSDDSSQSLSSSRTSVSEDDPVCIVGMACRLPGDVKSPPGLWDFLMASTSHTGTRAGVMDADGGYLIQQDIREFENSFFGINNVEATHMDPQQRKVLEVVYECLESAGISMEAAAGTNTGVYVGNFTFDHHVKQSRDLDYLHQYSSTGSTPTIMSNRISHVFNFHGPSFTVDTACSSSTYGLHSAVLEFSGIVKSVGPGDVNGLQSGDRVVVMAPNYWSTMERVPAWCAHKMLPNEDFATMATIGVAYSTALYALKDRAYLRAGESILIHSGAGSFGLAAISIAQKIGAIVYTTVGSPEKREFLEKELGVPSSNIFHSRDESFVADVKTATGGRGVHVVINSLTGDLMHASWGCVAKFGRFVEMGQRELADAGKLDMHKFLQNTTFTAFDYADFLHDEDPYYHELLIQKAKEVLQLYRAGEITPGPITKFDGGDVGQAYRYFSARERIGKVVVSLENPKTLVPAVPPKHRAFFDPDKAYILVGCLGGLGRSLSRWMMSRGARNFVFLGRSGADKPQAKELVTRLESTGANVSVVRGDVSNAEDVVATVAACEGMGKPVGGVVQGAMGLHEALFSSMTSDMWHTGIQPKWAGSWNLHNALEGHDQELDFSELDFFLLMSSISGSMGTATESNYCAANAFLDTFAQWRRCQGKTAVSVGLGMISEVGYLHENPDIQSILLRKGIQPLNEQEFLHIIDFALGGTGETIDHTPQWERSPGAAHILTGLELSGVFELMERGFEVNHTSMDDPRAALVTAALQAGQETRVATQGEEVQVDISDISWLKDVPSTVAGQFQSEADAASLAEAALRVISKQFSNLILMPLDNIDTKKPLAQFGVDSMIASEFRSWFWSALKVDIPFLDLMSQTKCLDSLAETTEASLVKG